MTNYAATASGLRPLGNSPPDVVMELSQRLITLYTIKDWPRVAEAAGKLLRHDSVNELGLKVRTYALMSLGNFSAALIDAEELVRLDPDDDHYYELRASARSNTGDLVGALEDYTLLVERDPDSRLYRNSVAGILATSPEDAVRDGARAVALAEAVVEEDGAATHHYLDTLASAYAEVGRFGDAVARQEQANALLPDGEDRQPFESRIELYRQGRPYRTATG